MLRLDRREMQMSDPLHQFLVLERFPEDGPVAMIFPDRMIVAGAEDEWLLLASWEARSLLSSTPFQGFI